MLIFWKVLLQAALESMKEEENPVLSGTLSRWITRIHSSTWIKLKPELHINTYLKILELVNTVDGWGCC